MAELDKVIKCLELCRKLTGSCEGCPYENVPPVENCMLTMHGDALELLKEQEDLGTELTNAVELIHKKNERIEKLLKEQDAVNGEWITIWQENDPDTSIHARCSICNRISERPLGGYCKWCGAKMSQEWGVDG